MGLLAVFAKGAFGVLASLAQSRLSTTAGQTLRDQTIASLLLAGSQAPSPTTIARLSSRLREAEAAVAQGPFSVARAVAQLLPIAVGLAFVSPTLTLLAIVVLVPFSLALSLARRRWRRSHESSMRASDLLHEEMDDLIRHLDLWRSCGSGHHVRDLLHRLGTQAASAHVRAQTIGVAISSANEVLGAAALLAVLIVASQGLAEVDGASVIAFVAIFFLAYRPLRDLGDARTAWLRGREALQTLANLPSPASSPDPPGDPCPRPGPAHVHVENLSVPDRSPPIGFDLAPGRMVALAGATGAGKTSLLRALLGLEPTASGTVSVDGQLVSSEHVGPSFRPFAWVPQDAPVVSGSLDDNLRIGGADPDLAHGKLVTLGAFRLVRDLGETKLGAGGRPLSGGERRWVSLARALATGLPVLLLDEPTVGLDAQARAAVLDVLRQVKGKRSVVVASHDAEVLALADDVVTLS
jgi:ABC-type multidrug transport system fused ATPase/permease subunit